MANHPNRSKKRGPVNNSSRAHKVWADKRMNRQGTSVLAVDHSKGWELIAAFAKSVRSMLKGLKPNRGAAK